MPKREGTKVFSADMDSDLIDRFRQNVKSGGFVQYRAIAGALMLWMSLPASIQVKISTSEYGEDILFGVIQDIFRNPPDNLKKRVEDFYASLQKTPEI